MREKPEIHRIDVVFLGDFNPKIFSPAWLAAQGLIGEQESEASKVEIIHSDISIFSLSWCRAQITRDRFSMFTEQEAYFGILYDLIANIFRILEHTPIHSFGYNWGMHFLCDSENEWHSLGHYLVPQEPWRNIFKDSGMLKLEVVEKHQPEDPLEGKMQIRVEPSRRLRKGVLINVNEHYEIQDKNKVSGCRPIMSIFEENWEKSKNNSEELIVKLLSNFKEAK